MSKGNNNEKRMGKPCTAEAGQAEYRYGCGPGDGRDTARTIPAKRVELDPLLPERVECWRAYIGLTIHTLRFAVACLDKNQDHLTRHHIDSARRELESLQRVMGR